MSRKKKKIKYIRNKCIEVNPDIIKLQPQCKIKIGDEIYTTINVIEEKMFNIKTSKEETQYNLMMTKDGNSGISHLSVWESEVNEEIDEIIGRPIRLADIIILLNKIFYGEIPEEAEEMIFDAGNDYDWDLYNDDLEKQKQETIDLIYSFAKMSFR